MTLASGRTLAFYEVLAPLGAGAMGEVYRAKDTRLDREVAIKVLPTEFASDVERLRRFEREAKSLASLNHPNIAQIHGVDQVDTIYFLVLELVEGETLEQRLKRGPLPLDEALDVCRQIAEGLEAAHEAGVIHRDLKPANIRITPSGAVKLLDFGLAKPMRAGDEAQSSTDSVLATEQGRLLGTPTYMAPEQARGKPIDKRVDIWAFGCVLYECLTAKRAFSGETLSDVLASVLDKEPDWTRLPPTTPARIRELLRRCFAKDPRQRLRDIGDARTELADGARGEASHETIQPPLRASHRLWKPLVVVVAIVAALLGGTFIGRRSVHSEPPTFRPLTFARGFVHSARFAPDGQTVIYGAAFEGRPLALFSTRTDAFESRAMDLPSADVAGISKDGQMALLLGRHNDGSWLRVGTLAQVALAGGAPREILEEVFDADISPDGQQFAVVVGDGDDQVLQYPIGKELFRTPGWISQCRIAPDGRRIAFVDHRVLGDDLGEVKFAGTDGKVVRLTVEQQYSQGVCWSPDGSEIWLTAAEDTGGGTLWRVSPGDAPRIVLRTPTPTRIQDVAAGGRILLLEDESRATLAGQLAGDSSERIYSWWDNDSAAAISLDGAIYAGHNPSVVVGGEYAVFFRRGGTPPVQLGVGLAAGMTHDGKSIFTASLTSNRSILTVQPVGPGQPKSIDLGNITPEAGTAHLTCSSNGRRVAFIGTKPGVGRAAWVMDLDDSAPRAVSLEGAYAAVISPDGSKVAVSDPKRGMYVVSAAGGKPEPVAGAPKEDVPLAWSPDGREVMSWDRTLPPRIYRTALDGGHRELVRELVPPDPAGILYEWLTLSPDGRFYLQRYRRVLSTAFLVTIP